MSGRAARSLLEKLSSVPSYCPHHGGGEATPIKVAKLSSTSSTRDSTDYAFEMISSTLRFGRGVTAEIGEDILSLGAKNTVVLTDKQVIHTRAFRAVADSLTKHHRSFAVFEDVQVEPCDKSMITAIEFARKHRFDSFIAVGGGSVMDTAKAAALYTSNPLADFLDFVGPPFGRSLQPERPMLPLIAVPTTSGTGSETTGVAIMDLPEHSCKTGIRLRCIKPLLAIVDPLNVLSMPRNVAVYSGFDVLCHALESYTALPYNRRSPCPSSPSKRPLYQGSNPISDVWSLEALRMIARYFRRAVLDEDEEAKAGMLMASSFAGVGFGNAGVHICHGLSYPISSQGKKFTDRDYPINNPFIPHGLSVVTTAIADFEFLAPSSPERHAEAARQLGCHIPANASPEYIAKTLGDQIRKFMLDFNVPNGLKALGFSSEDLPKLTEAAMHSVPNIAISPRKTDAEIIQRIYEKSMNVY